MKKIFYDKNGIVCERLPLYVEKTENFIEVNDDDYEKTFSTALHFVWKVVDGRLINERYEENSIEETTAEEIKNLKIELEKIKEDVEQVELFGMTRKDYETKKARCVQIILRLRELENL